ncbi:TonB-dependent receptor domain-containing protein [Flavobacterium sp. 14A]|uniref:TonB-dependent receptor n=1 Tax=Flavobacterium sp. 14A TaxID=2735896 RepID=UPI00156EE8A1|nr:TonB-dependent receptor [Flavobacterium sp. 14A]
MKTMKNWLFSGMLFLVAVTAFSQGKVTGTITDGQGSLPGANVAIKGATTGVSADFNGKFSINSTTSKGELVISFIGFENKIVKFSVADGGTVNLGSIVLTSNSNELDEIVVTSSVIDIAKDRKTPVAVSTIKASEIQEKLGSQEFPEILANTPSVYVTKQGGGYGDSRINIRGFDQRNIAVMINGVPVNDMENGSVYWSNWAGLSDVTSAMQVQRGLGSSKLAISSVGGTINVVTRTSDMKEGGSVSSTFGNDNYLKVQGSYNTGVMDNGLSASVLISSTTGDGYVNGTSFEGKNYFLALGYKPNDKHDFQFTFTGAPQWHHQRSFANKISEYIKYGDAAANEPNIKYNSDFGYRNGQEFSFARNFYSKPVASFNWDFKINDNTKLSAVAYGSWGRGGGTGSIGSNPYSAPKTADGLMQIDEFVKYNNGQPNAVGSGTNLFLVPNADGQNIANSRNGYIRRASINSHNWYGAVVNMNKKLSEQVTLDFGIDARTYTGFHFRNLSDLLGADGYLDNADINNPNRTLTKTYDSSASLNPFSNVKDQEKIAYNNNGYVTWLGAFTQLEYSVDNISAFFQGAVSQQGFKREDTFTYLESDPLYKTDFENLIGGNVKGGVNYNVSETSNVFVNTGFYSKQPFFNAVYPNNQSVVAANLVNEKVFGLEGGYGFRSKVFTANLNVYYTSWRDRYQRNSDPSIDNVGGYYDYNGLTEIHSGVELEMNAKPTPKLSLNAMISIGNWFYKGNVSSNRFDIDNNVIGGGVPTTLYLDKLKVGDAAQNTASIGAKYEVVERLSLDANYRVSDKLYASIDPSKFTTEENNGTLQLPSYGLMDAGLSYKLLLGANKLSSLNFRINVNNVLDEVYISESRTNNFATATSATYDGVDTSNQVYFGFGRTWNFSLRYNF